MDASVILQQMLVLFSMMLVGYFFFKKGVLDEAMEKKLSWIVVNFMNPCLIIASVAGKSASGNQQLIGQNFILVIALYAGYILLSPLLHRVLRVPVEQRGLYTLMTTFSNLGFMGLPIVTRLYGNGAAIYVVFYMLSYNVLIYTYGLIIAGKYSKEGKGGINLKRMLNPGNYSSLLAIALFLLKVELPTPVQSFLSYFGNATIPFSMMLIGLSMAKVPWKELLQGKRVYLFCLFKLLVIPIASIYLVRLLPFDPMLKGIFIILGGTPVGSIAILIAGEYGISGKDGTQGIILSTVFSVITLPIIAVLF